MNESTTLVKLGFKSEESYELLEKLNLLLCNLQIHYQKLRSYHWNVKGPAFFDLHAIFEKEYNAVKVEIDEIAERIRVFNKIPVSTLKEYLAISEIRETTPNLTSKEMVSEIIDDIETLLGFLIDAVDEAGEMGDIATDDLLSSMIKRKEKTHWMLSAFNA
jgi:starvation-inducible DNA-binding protein